MLVEGVNKAFLTRINDWPRRWTARVVYKNMYGLYGNNLTNRHPHLFRPGKVSNFKRMQLPVCDIQLLDGFL
jgi:hypothetical protein